jgi:hypothetical protein
MKKRMRAVVFSLLLVVISAGSSFADNAEVLPKGVSSIMVNSKFYLSISQRYDSHGNREDLAADYNANLNSEIFPALALVESGFGMPSGSASVGSSVVSMKYNLNSNLTVKSF